MLALHSPAQPSKEARVVPFSRAWGPLLTIPLYWLPFPWTHYLLRRSTHGVWLRVWMSLGLLDGEDQPGYVLKSDLCTQSDLLSWNINLGAVLNYVSCHTCPSRKNSKEKKMVFFLEKNKRMKSKNKPLGFPLWISAYFCIEKQCFLPSGKRRALGP